MAGGATEPDGGGGVDVLGTIARMFDWPDSVTVGEFVVEVDDVSAAVWLSALCRRRSYRIIDLAEPDTAARLRAAAMGGRLGERERVEAFQQLLERATGRRWWQAENLAIFTVTAWHALIGPTLTRAGWDVADLTISQLLDFTYATLERNVKPDEWGRVRASLQSKPADVESGDPDDMVMDEEEFQRTASEL